ncbi:MAG TPA: flagellar basal body rod protein FlgB [Bacillota bacterium]|nr:flagellar basal body rod protein FlgB [Bacillota bacterium]
MNIFDQTIFQLERSLNYSAAKNKVIANNIANVDTPNYKAKDVAFKTVLEGKMRAKTTHPKHLPFAADHRDYQLLHKTNTIYNHNNNNVDIDKEMSQLAKNQIHYQSLIDRLNGKFSDIQTVVRGGN